MQQGVRTLKGLPEDKNIKRRIINNLRRYAITVRSRVVFQKILNSHDVGQFWVREILHAVFGEMLSVLGVSWVRSL